MCTVFDTIQTDFVISVVRQELQVQKHRTWVCPFRAFKTVMCGAYISVCTYFDTGRHGKPFKLYMLPNFSSLQTSWPN